MNRIALAAFVFAALATYSNDATAQERIWLNVRIRHGSEKLAFDSGASCSALIPEAVQRLGLKTRPYTFTNLPGIVSGMTKELPVRIEGGPKVYISFAVLEMPWYASLGGDGLIGWTDLTDRILRLDADHNRIEFLGKRPKETALFTRLNIVTNYGMLDLEIPSSVGTNRVLCIDTGDPCGLCLPKAEWQRWKEAHTHIPSTLDTTYAPSEGFYLFEQAWADEIQIGPLKLTDVPIEQDGPGRSKQYGERYAATLGMAALRQLDVVVDGPAGRVYIRSKEVQPKPFEHNRLGAVFAPDDAHKDQAIARVVPGSPAYQAGVRRGDRLLQVDDVEIRSWTSDWLGKFKAPAGTKLKLKLERNNTNFTATATLRDIVAPRAKQNTAAAEAQHLSHR